MQGVAMKELLGEDSDDGSSSGSEDEDEDDEMEDISEGTAFIILRLTPSMAKFKTFGAV